MIAKALPDKQIAYELGLSRDGVKSHVKRIYNRLSIPTSLNRRVALANLINHHDEQRIPRRGTA